MSLRLATYKQQKKFIMSNLLYIIFCGSSSSSFATSDADFELPVSVARCVCLYVTYSNLVCLGGQGEMSQMQVI
jgi:hypothetical protein